jgi:ABC-type nickel/cobalt efflux system permease component RcnA
MARTLWHLAVILALIVVASTGVAYAHPLGNFTINHLAKIAAAKGALRVRYILDIAEIPTFQIMHDARGSWAQRQTQWADSEVAVVQTGLHVTIDGVPVALQPHSVSVALRPGAGGLPIIRWVGEFSVATSRGVAHRVAVRDEVYAERRIGWKDIIAGVQSEPTNELRRYPSALIGTPRRVNAATFVLHRSGSIDNVVERSDETTPSGTLTPWIAPGALSDMFAQPNQTPWFVVLTVLVAFGLGALHAMEPGHGKALLAFTLVGARATSRQALTLALSLTFAHTAGVLLLGLALFAFAGFVSESIYPWITLVSGAAIAAIGGRSLAAYVRRRRGHGHSHSHTAAGNEPLNFRTAVLAAMSGGIAPCPAAIVVLLTALRLHHLGNGILLIVVFSLGLAGVLSGLGIAVVHGADWLSKRSTYARVTPYGPLVTALIISAIGAWTLASGFSQSGVAAPPLLVALITLAAIAGYAFGQQGHDHPHAHEGVSAT